jgi:L-threonylcarbamoyladenylate synthase
MQTVLTTSPQEAAGFIKRGGIVAFPTETVDNPLIAHVANVHQIFLLASSITESARQFIEAFFPGSLTIVLPKSARVPTIATAGLQTVGVRMPRHEGRPSPTIWQAVYEDLNGRIDCILQGEQTEIGLESTVVDCTGDVPLVLRAGAVTLEQLQTIVPQTRFANTKEDEPARSPGLKHRHYSPRARVRLINSPDKAEAGKENAYIGLEAVDSEFGLLQVCSSLDEYAHNLFLFFRLADEKGIKTIFCQKVEEKDLGLALMDRLKRAAGARNDA